MLYADIYSKSIIHCYVLRADQFMKFMYCQSCHRNSSVKEAFKHIDSGCWFDTTFSFLFVQSHNILIKGVLGVIQIVIILFSIQVLSDNYQMFEYACIIYVVCMYP